MGATHNPIDHGAVRRSASINEVAISWLEAPDPRTVSYESDDSTVIVFLHGAFASAESFQFQLREFSGDYRLFAPDLPGHGQSAGMTEPHTVEGYASILRELYSRWQIERAVIVGHSMGGFVAQEMALSHPDSVEALVLVDTSYGIATNWWDSLMSGIAHWYMSVTKPPALVRTFANEQGKHNDVTRAYLYSAMERYLTDKEQMMAIWHAVETFSSVERLADILAPTLVVSPTLSAQAAGLARRMEYTIPRARRVIIPDAGHMVMMDNPAGFNRVLREFLAE